MAAAAADPQEPNLKRRPASDQHAGIASRLARVKPETAGKGWAVTPSRPRPASGPLEMEAIRIIIEPLPRIVTDNHHSSGNHDSESALADYVEIARNAVAAAATAPPRLRACLLLAGNAADYVRLSSGPDRARSGRPAVAHWHPAAGPRRTDSRLRVGRVASRPGAARSSPAGRLGGSGG